MPLNNDGCIIKAVGFVAIYSAYLEDDLANLVKKAKTFICFKKEVEQFRLGEQAKILRKELNRSYKNSSAFFLKEEDQKRVNSTLKNIERLATKRNQILHSPIIAQDNVDIQHDRKSQSSKKITSAEIYNIANKIDRLCSCVMSLESCIDKLGFNITVIRKGNNV